MNQFVLAVDGGGSKTDVVALSLDGTLLGSARGPGSNPQTLGRERSLDIISGLAVSALEQALAASGGSLRSTHVYLAGLDLPAELMSFSSAIEGVAWATGAGDTPAIVDNDLFALLRAGTDEHNAVAVVCGTGINAVGVREDGASARFPALGAISGDWGGGYHLGEQTLWNAARGQDGRGEPTILQELVPPVFGLASIPEVIEAFHFQRLPMNDLNRLVPTLFAAADQGDAVAASVVDHQAEEIVSLARVALSRLGLLEHSVPLVLGGGVLAAANPRLMGGIADRLSRIAPLVRVQLVRHPPIVGAGLLALEAAGAEPSALVTAASALERIGRA